jgi:linearmycin/streptolysin S transport system permease protein
MAAVLAIALKDLRLLFRVRAAFFFTMVWPLLVAVVFGSLFGGGNRGPSRLAIAITDEDQTSASKAFVDGLAAREGFDVLRTTDAEARDLVRRGQRIGAILVPKGFGAASEHLFYGASPKVELRIDPARQAETSMLQGFLLEQGARRMQTLFNDPGNGQARVAGMLADVQKAPAGAIAGQAALQNMLASLDTYFAEQKRAEAAAAEPGAEPSAKPKAAAGAGWQPLEIAVSSIERQREGPANGYQITFPQGMQWGILGCMMSFAVSLAVERSRGTLTRLLMSPAPSWALLAGKGLACYLAILIVQAALMTIGATFFGVRPSSWLLLGLALAIVPIGFVGLMMFVASLGTTEQGSAGAGWAIMMPMSMLGGGMVPLAVMPAWMQSLSVVSPVRWMILAYEGAIWRGFSIAEMAVPCAILVTIGVVAFGFGARRFQATLV